ncbi:hypothetical protein TDB9533_01950 [Thalassocella blandensis]|nr:hypothetical protein TDB9533_01950 [Thalassocella blandensis]
MGGVETVVRKLKEHPDLLQELVISETKPLPGSKEDFQDKTQGHKINLVFRESIRIKWDADLGGSKIDCRRKSRRFSDGD